MKKDIRRFSKYASLHVVPVFQDDEQQKCEKSPEISETKGNTTVEKQISVIFLTHDEDAAEA